MPYSRTLQDMPLPSRGDSRSSRRRLAEALLASGSSTAPVQHWTQGLARVAQALAGSYGLYKEDEREKKLEADAQQIALSHPALQYGGTAPATGDGVNKSLGPGGQGIPTGGPSNLEK